MNGFDSLGCEGLICYRIVYTVALCLPLSRFEGGVVYFYVALVFPERECCVKDVPCSVCELGQGREGVVCVPGEGGCRAAEFDGCHIDLLYVTEDLRSTDIIDVNAKFV